MKDYCRHGYHKYNVVAVNIINVQVFCDTKKIIAYRITSFFNTQMSVNSVLAVIYSVINNNERRVVERQIICFPHDLVIFTSSIYKISILLIN